MLQAPEYRIKCGRTSFQRHARAKLDRHGVKRIGLRFAEDDLGPARIDDGAVGHRQHQSLLESGKLARPAERGRHAGKVRHHR